MPPTTRCDFVRFLLSQSLPVQGQQNGTWDRRIYCDRGRAGRTRASRMRRAPVRPRPQALAVSRPVSACAVSRPGWTAGREEDEPEASPSCGSSSERHPNPPVPTPNHPEPTPCFRNGKRANRREASHQPNGRILTAVRKLIREALIKTRERGGEW